MTSFMPDTSCIFPIIKVNHQHTERAANAIESRIEAGQDMVLAAHSLLETYANLTSAPSGPRPSARMAAEAVQAFIARASSVVALDAPGYAGLVASLSERGLMGGSVYDALIFECARLAGVDTLLTFNQRDFGRFGAGVRVVIP